MSKLFALTLTSMVAFTGIANAGPGSSLGDCYNYVITACNETAHPVPCAESAMDDCDEIHSAQIELPKYKLTKMRKKAERKIQMTRQ